MNFTIFDLFDYIKNQQYEKFIESLDYIIDNKLTVEDIDLNLKDNNNNYLINYLVIQNNYKLLKKLFQINDIKIDIFDSDNKNILYIPIKYNYDNIFNLLLDYNKKTIGVSICDIKDKNNNIALHYAINYKNIEFIKLLLDNNSNINIEDNDGNNSFHLSILSRDIDIVKLIFKSSNDKLYIINSRTLNGYTPIHYATNLQEIKILEFLLENNADINLQDYENEFNIIISSIKLRSKEIFLICLKYNIDINKQDIYGNTILHYIILEELYDFFEILIDKYDLNCNLWNIDGKLPLHLYFDIDNINFSKNNILDYLVLNTNLNIQDNNYISCLHLLCKFNIWEEFEDILIKKKLDILVKNNDNIRPIDYILKLKDDKITKFLNIITNSYLYLIQKKKEKIWQSEWENICKNNDDITNDDIKNLKNNNISYNKNQTKQENCKKFILNKIKDLINENDNDKCNNKSFPVNRGKLCIKLDDIKNNNIPFCTFTGSSLDIIFGLIYLLKKHNKSCSTIPNNFIKNNELCDTYNNNNININNKCHFLNFEIVWAFNKIHFVDKLDYLLNKCLYNDIKRFIIIPLGIELQHASHANYIIFDKELGEIERFEPHGSGILFNFNYNPNLLDDILENKFSELLNNKIHKKIKYYRPSDFLPKISLQLLDITEKRKHNIGDPGGFCALWSIFYTDMRLTYNTIPRHKIIKYIIKIIKQQNISYKNLIRNYASNIIELRDIVLNKINITINEWLNENFTNKQYEYLIKEIQELIYNI
jgi:ankyrin repeat protein